MLQKNYLSIVNLVNEHNALPHVFFAFLASLFRVDEIQGITVDEIENRAKLHESCDANSICDSSYYVGGFHSMDFIAWANVFLRSGKLRQHSTRQNSLVWEAQQ